MGQVGAVLVPIGNHFVHQPDFFGSLTDDNSRFVLAGVHDISARTLGSPYNR